jgi:hypothetical protein
MNRTPKKKIKKKATCRTTIDLHLPRMFQRVVLVATASSLMSLA